MLLEYPDDISARSLSTQYMLGGSVLVAPVFDQPKHNIYLPEGSWIDLETGERMCGGRWIVYPKNIEVIPMFLRENTMMPMLADAPDHITDEVFKDLTLVMNVTDNLSQCYYDDGIFGECTASLTDGVLSITLEEIPAVNFRVYAGSEIRKAMVNGEEKPVSMDGNTYVF